MAGSHKRFKDLLARIADPETDRFDLVESIRLLGAVSEGPGFWSTIANDNGYSQDHRRRAVYELFRRHVKIGMTLADLAVLLDNPTWLDDEALSLVTIVGGRLPVSWSMEDTIFILPIFTDLPDRYYAFWAVYLKASGKVDRRDFVDILRGRPVDEAAAQAQILEIGLVPADPSPDDD